MCIHSGRLQARFSHTGKAKALTAHPGPPEVVRAASAWIAARDRVERRFMTQTPSAVSATGHGRGRYRNRSRIRKNISRYSGYFVMRTLHAVVCRLPLPAGRALGRFAGRVAYFLAGRQRRVGIRNLRRVYGEEWSERKIRQVTRRVFQNVATSMAEWVILRRWPSEKLLEYCSGALWALDGIHDDMVRLGPGGVGLCAHFGNWEVLSLLYGRHRPGFLFPIANRIYFRKYQEFFHEMRTSGGIEVIYSDESPRKILRKVREGKMPSMLADVDLRTNSGVFVDFFGAPTYTITFPVEVARKYNRPIGVVLLWREGTKFQATYSGPIQVPKTEDEQADILAGTQAWSSWLEQEIRKRPDQWMWIHPRWRTTPDKPRRKTDRPPRR